jgi:hypothetical protein
LNSCAPKEAGKTGLRRSDDRGSRIGSVHIGSRGRSIRTVNQSLINILECDSRVR